MSDMKSPVVDRNDISLVSRADVERLGYPWPRRHPMSGALFVEQAEFVVHANLKVLDGRAIDAKPPHAIGKFTCENGDWAKGACDLGGEWSFPEAQWFSAG